MQGFGLQPEGRNILCKGTAVKYCFHQRVRQGLTIMCPALITMRQTSLIACGDLASHEDYKSNKRKVYNGKLLAYVQSTGKPGEVKITLSSPGLPSKVIAIGSFK